MASFIMGTPTSADNHTLNQLEFFLFLADSIEIDGELTTPIDLETLPLESSKTLDTMEESSNEVSAQIDGAPLMNSSIIEQNQEEQP